jgi:hypothetical protein
MCTLRGLVDEFDGKDCFYLIGYQENACLCVPYKLEYKVTLFPIGALEEKPRRFRECYKSLNAVSERQL